MAELSTSIRELRERAGITQVELAQVSGIHQPNVSLIENGLRVPNPATMTTIRQAIAQVASTKIESLQSVVAEVMAV